MMKLLVSIEIKIGVDPNILFRYYEYIVCSYHVDSLDLDPRHFLSINLPPLQIGIRKPAEVAIFLHH